METFDLENFPTSGSAKRMLGYVSAGVYDNSYVGKWLFQAMGMEYDAARQIVEELPAQFFPETATWGLMYHEVKWGLPVRLNLPYEERRKRIYQKRDCRAPMTPYRIERYLESMTGFEAHVADVCDSGAYGFTAPHPNVFKVYFKGEGTLPVRAAYEALDRLKQSHTVYTVNDRTEIQVDHRELERFLQGRVALAAGIAFFGRFLLDGSWGLDGSVTLGQNTGLPLACKLSCRMKIFLREWACRFAGKVLAKAIHKELADVKTGHSAGSVFWDLERAADGIKMGICSGICTKEDAGAVSITIKTEGYWHMDGAICLDGSRRLDSVYEKEEME